MENLAESALPALFVLPVLAVALAASGSRRTGSAALLFLVLLTLDGFLVSAPVVYDVAQVPGANWNWSGKALSLAWALAFIGFGPLSRRDVGLTFRQRPNSLRPAALVTVGLVLLGVTIGAAFGGGGPLRVETLAYQLTMPGVAEELAFRGVFLALLHRAAPAEAGAAVFWWPAVVTTLAFAFTHSPSLEGGRIAFAFLPFLLPLVAGAAFAWLREKTGSLLWPTIAHNGLNAAIFVSGSVAGAA